MQRSANPKGFPTKQELLAAGRTDLVEAIAAQGGWLAFGWDLDDGNASPDPAVSTEDSTASTSGRSVEGEDGDSVGVDGILSRLDKERRLSFTPGKREKGMSGRVSQWTGEHDPGDSGIGLETGNPADYRDTRSSTPDTWRQWSLQRAGFPATGFEAAEIAPNKGLEQVVEHRRASVSMDADMHTTNNPTETGGLRNTPHSHAKESNEQIHIHLQHLELKLKSVRSLLRSRTNGVASHKGQESSVKELHRLSDALEFQETEIMNARDKLRSTRAQLAVLEGKMALQIIEGQKRMTEKEKRLDASKKTLLLLRTTCISWPTSASEVLLVGSFDGWTSQRRMERSSSGVFSLCLKLYPGRYEIKFIVDGIWKVDPLRPIVRNNGNENNLIIVT